MRINHNIMAINTHRSYGINNANVAKSSEKLSSGYRINRAGDDAAGLAISEKMRAQIRGLNMASKNSQDAISLVQTTEGALQEVHNILQRMRELSVQSASDTNDTKVDRKALDLEVQQLKEEITAISEVTTFNGIGVLKPTSGLVNNYKIQSGANAADVLNLNINGLSLSNIGSPIIQSQPAAPTIPPIAPKGVNVATDTQVIDFYDAINLGKLLEGASATATSANIKALDLTKLDATTGTAADNTGIKEGVSAADVMKMLEYLKTNNLGGNVKYEGNIASDLDSMITVISQAASEGKQLSEAGFADKSASSDGKNLTDLNKLLKAAVEGLEAKYVSDVNNFAKDAVQFTIQTNNVQSYYDSGASAITTTFTAAESVGIRTEVTSGGAYSATTDAIATTGTLKTANDMLDTAKIFLGTLAAGSVSGLAGSDSTTPKAVDISSVSVSTRVGASFAITKVNDAVNSLSLERAQLGAYQNRLEHKIANLDTSAENLQAAESRIRDVDMAKEMTEFTKNNILSQAATAMLAQANNAPQGVLQLLR